MEYNESYYASNSQDRDRPALWFYSRIWRRYVGVGPVLEFGCGVGHFARRLSSAADVVGLEINPYAIEKIRSNAPAVRVVTDLAAVDTGSVGSIVSLHVLEHIPDRELLDVGAEFFRVLRPGGRLVIVVPDKGGAARFAKQEKWLGYRDPTHVNLKTAEEWSRWFVERWRFSIVRCGADGYYDFPYGKGALRSLVGDGLKVIRTALQFLAGRLLLDLGDGEACIFVLEKK